MPLPDLPDLRSPGQVRNDARRDLWLRPLPAPTRTHRPPRPVVVTAEVTDPDTGETYALALERA